MNKLLATTCAMALMCGTAMAADTSTSSTMSNDSTATAPHSSAGTMTMGSSNPTDSATTNESSTGSMNSMAPASGDAMATATNIKALPDDGKMVRIMGTVKDVKGDDKFTLMDGTGTVKVKTQQAMQLNEGDKVTVMGKVDKGLMGKSIEDAQVKKGFESSSNEYVVAANDMPQGASTGWTGGSVSNGAMMDSGMEAPANPNMENDNSQNVKPYTKNMSMNDYNTKNKTKNHMQTNIQPENGAMSSQYDSRPSGSMNNGSMSNGSMNGTMSSDSSTMSH